jgi:thiamine pyrophosphokinase
MEYMRSISSSDLSVSSIFDVVIMGSLSGRVDQGLGLLGELLRESKRSPSGTQLWLVSECSISWLLPPGTSFIAGLDAVTKDTNEAIFTTLIGILPIYGPSVISTEGLKWDVSNWDTKMGGNVSTSNQVVAGEVKVKTTEWVMFTVERATSEW